LILIARIEILDLFLASVSLEIAVREGVQRECCGVEKTLDALLIQKALDKSRIKVVAVKDRKLVGKLEHDFSLSRGEAQAIALAVVKQAKLLAIDDKNGINACKLLDIAFATAAGILVRCREKRLLNQEEALARLELREKYGRHKGSILEDVKARLQGRK
jgi:predicted nucleic acid-binding protein